MSSSQPFPLLVDYLHSTLSVETSLSPQQLSLSLAKSISSTRNSQINILQLWLTSQLVPLVPGFDLRLPSSLCFLSQPIYSSQCRTVPAPLRHKSHPQARLPRLFQQLLEAVVPFVPVLQAVRCAVQFRHVSAVHSPLALPEAQWSLLPPAAVQPQQPVPRMQLPSPQSKSTLQNAPNATNVTWTLCVVVQAVLSRSASRVMIGGRRRVETWHTGTCRALQYQ